LPVALLAYLLGCGTGALVALGCASSTPAARTASDRPAAWAQPVSLAGCENLHRVSKDLYRGAQPDEELGFKRLKELGVKTVVNLRSLHGESGEVKAAGLEYEHIFFEPWKRPEEKELVRFLKIVTDPARAPVFVHCLHGADRTGTMVAVYRAAVQGWDKKEAAREMREGGYGFHGDYYESYARYVEELDLDRVKKAAGLR
jgi:protein tyrosine phosphatase (PTP) superfamily phosphohydrolase (DUF442 family)